MIFKIGVLTMKSIIFFYLAIFFNTLAIANNLTDQELSQFKKIFAQIQSNHPLLPENFLSLLKKFLEFYSADYEIIDRIETAITDRHIGKNPGNIHECMQWRDEIYAALGDEKSVFHEELSLWVFRESVYAEEHNIAQNFKNDEYSINIVLAKFFNAFDTAAKKHIRKNPLNVYLENTSMTTKQALELMKKQYKNQKEKKDEIYTKLIQFSLKKIGETKEENTNHLDFDSMLNDLQNKTLKINSFWINCFDENDNQTLPETLQNLITLSVGENNTKSRRNARKILNDNLFYLFFIMLDLSFHAKMELARKLLDIQNQKLIYFEWLNLMNKKIREKTDFSAIKFYEQYILKDKI
jgi:hypothetical protein